MYTASIMTMYIMVILVDANIHSMFGTKAAILAAIKIVISQLFSSSKLHVINLKIKR